MRDPLSTDRLLCRLLGHKWKPCHKVGRTDYGLLAWIYVDDVCTRCWKNQYRMPTGDRHQEQLPCLPR